jgi:site-specific recombinase XerD
MGEITLQQVLDEFKTTYMPARNLAARTRVEYANDLKDFISFLGKSGVTRTGELSTYQVDRYLAKLDELGYSGSTRKRKAITFRSFLSFLYRNGYISHDISRQVILPFPEYPTPRILTQMEYQKLLMACSSNIRDYAIVALLLQTGIRLSELVRLTLSDVHIPETIDIIGKGSRGGRTIPLNSKACEALQAYITIRPASEYPSLFLNHYGNPLGERGVQKKLMLYFHQAGIPGASVHSLRHTFAVQHIVRGTNIITVKKILGHSDIRTTQEYIPLANQVAKMELEVNTL